MPTPSSGPSGFDDQETSQGGADAVPDTPGVAGHGADLNERRSGPRARVSSSGGLSSAAWVGLVVVALLLLLLYGGGFFA
jgi:hypothetical protein